MSEIKVGEYVRTFNGNIFKIIGGNSDDYDIDIDYWKLEATEESWIEGMEYNDNEYFFYEKYKNIKKHSFNIIDLIEEGDYVNGHKIPKFKIEINEYGNRYLFFYSFDKQCAIFEKDIKSIVTKERFEESEYRINE